MSEFDTDKARATGSEIDVSVEDIDQIVDNVFVELQAGRATVQSRSRNFYEVVIPFDKLPEELKQAVCS